MTPAFRAGALTKVAKTVGRREPTSSERAAFVARHGRGRGCSLKADRDGFYVHTHRARSKSYPSPDKIPAHKVKFIESTG